jgi:DnaJ-class molecular chaperone
MIICHHCKGNGYVKIRFEAEQAIEQCSVCHSQGEINENKYYHQTWSDGVSDETTSFYYGPPLDPESFKNYKIYPE